MTPPCVNVRRWLRDGKGPPSDDLARHVAGCAACRGALALALGDLTGAPAPATISCAACADDLDAYLELERAEGATAAARRYPRIWWHLWGCAECAETARLTGALLDAEAAGELASPPWAPAPPALIQLARAYLHQLFAPQAQLGVTWEAEDEPQLIADQQLPAGRLTLAISPTRGGAWDLLVQIEPPTPGTAALIFGAERATARLDAGGQARFGPIAGPLLAAVDGPDLVVEVREAYGGSAS